MRTLWQMCALEEEAREMQRLMRAVEEQRLEEKQRYLRNAVEKQHTDEHSIAQVRAHVSGTALRRCAASRRCVHACRCGGDAEHLAVHM